MGARPAVEETAPSALSAQRWNAETMLWGWSGFAVIGGQFGSVFSMRVASCCDKLFQRVWTRGRNRGQQGGFWKGMHTSANDCSFERLREGGHDPASGV